MSNAMKVLLILGIVIAVYKDPHLISEVINGITSILSSGGGK